MADDNDPQGEKDNNVLDLEEHRARLEEKRRKQDEKDRAAVAVFRRPTIVTQAKKVVGKLVDIKKTSPLVRELVDKIPHWITPNMVTIFRGCLLVPAILLLQYEWYWLAFVVLGVAFLLDFVDGALSEVRELKTETGKFIDPLADKFLICGTLLTLTSRFDSIFYWITMAVCSIAVLLTLARLRKMRTRHKQRHGSSIAASPAGKVKIILQVIATLCFVLSLAMASLPLQIIGYATLSFAVLLGLVSLVTQVT